MCIYILYLYFIYYIIYIYLFFLYLNIYIYIEREREMIYLANLWSSPVPFGTSPKVKPLPEKPKFCLVYMQNMKMCNVVYFGMLPLSSQKRRFRLESVHLDM